MLRFFKRPFGKLVFSLFILSLSFVGLFKANSATIANISESNHKSSYPIAEVQPSVDANYIAQSRRPKPQRPVPKRFLPFFDNINNPVSGLKLGSPADVTPPPPVLTNFDKAVNQLCGAPGKVVTEAEFKKMMNQNPTVLENIKTNVGGELISGRTSKAQFLDDLTTIWFKTKGFDHVFCGEPSRGSIGGLHYAARYLDLQNKGLAGRLPNNTANEEVVSGAIYTIGAVMRVGQNTVQSKIKGYPYTLDAEEILTKGAIAYKNNPSNQPATQACLLTVTDEGNTFKAVFVTKNGSIRTFYPDATPDTSPACKQ